MFHKILIPLDGSRLAARILHALERLLGGAATEVTLLRVVDPHSPAEHDRAPAAEVAIRAQLQQLQETLGSQVRSRVQLARGDPAHEITTYARETGQDLVAMATHGRTGVQRWVRGSVAERVLRTCQVPLLLCNPTALEPKLVEHQPFTRLLVPLDGSERALQVLPVVERLARGRAPHVTLLRVEPLVLTEVPSPAVEGLVWDPGPLEQSLAAPRDRLAAAGATVDVRVTYGVVAAEILQAARGADLLAMTTHGRTGLPRWWFGSVAEQVLRHAPCPVLVVRTVAVPEGARV
jgi:nucleotide-binding universal stress UspA family protein